MIDGALDSKLEFNGRVLPYVSVQGNVCADGNVLHSQSPHESHEGVIRKTEILEHKASWNATFENWYSAPYISNASPITGNVNFDTHGHSTTCTLTIASLNCI